MLFRSNSIAIFLQDSFIENPNAGELYPFVMRNRIILDQEDFLNSTRLNNMIKRNVMDGFWKEGSDISSIIVHELTHGLIYYLELAEYDLGRGIYITEDIADRFSIVMTNQLSYNQTMAKSICMNSFENYCNLIEVEITFSEFCQGILGYAAGLQSDGGISYGEIIAEAMTDYYLNRENMSSIFEW